MPTPWSVTRFVVAGAVLSLAATAAQAQEADAPEDEVSVSEEASEQGKESSEFGIETANEAREEAREEGREFGQTTRERAREQRQEATDIREDAGPR